MYPTYKKNENSHFGEHAVVSAFRLSYNARTHLYVLLFVKCNIHCD